MLISKSSVTLLMQRRCEIVGTSWHPGELCAQHDLAAGAAERDSAVAGAEYWFPLAAAKCWPPLPDVERCYPLLHLGQASPLQPFPMRAALSAMVILLG